jgi:AraC-like DNA-binding protein
MMEYPMPSLSGSVGVEEKHLKMNNHLANALWTEIKTPRFSIMDASLCAKDDVSMYSHMEENDAVWFCAALQGYASCRYHPHPENVCWQSGQANMFAYSDVDTRTSFKKNKPFRMIDIMLPSAYMAKIAEDYPSLHDGKFPVYAGNSLFRAYPENVPFCPAVGKALNELLDYKMAGNAALLYLDAKVREILSLFLCGPEKDCCKCNGNCFLPGDSDKFIEVKQIIEQQYLNPPSLRELALMVGTNECKLKNGFKILFGVTVFGHLFDYRMNLAARYLLDTGKTIQEIADLTGYGHQSHFSTAFKRKFCVSPQEYRTRTKG